MFGAECVIVHLLMKVLTQNFQVMLSFLCESINREWPTVKVQCLTPALVATKMTHYDNNYKSLFVKNAHDFAREAINTIGLASMTSGCFNHELQVIIVTMFPLPLMSSIY